MSVGSLHLSIPISVIAIFAGLTSEILINLFLSKKIITGSTTRE